MSLRNKVVFVDPDDDSCPYWWPALVVPKEHLHLFQQTINEQVPVNGTDLVVCYFEDGSFSVVPQNAVKPFSLTSEPYRSYQRDPETKKAFITDRAVIRATKFYTEGIVPLAFTWLHSSTSTDGRLIESGEDIEIEFVETASDVNEKSAKSEKVVSGDKNIEKTENKATSRISEKNQVDRSDSARHNKTNNVDSARYKDKSNNDRSNNDKNYSDKSNNTSNTSKSNNTNNTNKSSITGKSNDSSITGKSNTVDFVENDYYRNLESKSYNSQKGKKKRNLEGDFYSSDTKRDKEFTQVNSPTGKQQQTEKTEEAVESFLSKNSFFLTSSQPAATFVEFKVIKSLFPLPKIQLIKKILADGIKRM